MTPSLSLVGCNHTDKSAWSKQTNKNSTEIKNMLLHILGIKKTQPIKSQKSHTACFRRNKYIIYSDHSEKVFYFQWTSFFSKLLYFMSYDACQLITVLNVDFALSTYQHEILNPRRQLCCHWQRYTSVDRSSTHFLCVCVQVDYMKRVRPLECSK